MKKILLSAVLAATSWVLFAQDTTTHQTNGTIGTNGTMNNNTPTNQQMNSNTNQGTYPNTNTTSNPMYNSTTNTSNYSAYGIPNYVQSNFQSQHPNVSNLTWTNSTANFYHGYYADPTTGRYTHVYYSTDPYYNSQYYPDRVTGYTVSLPVLETWVPDQVITTALTQYKQNLYDIAAMKGNNNTNMYVVRVLDNGELKSMYMDSVGGAVTDYIRTEVQPTTDNMNNGNWNNGNTNTNNGTNSNSSMSNDTNGTMDNSSTGTTNDMNNTNTNMKTKTKTTMSDGSQTKTKTKNGKTTTKTSGSTNNNQF
jgi:hypothetical protein